MIEIPADLHVDKRDHGYYIAGTRISLDSIAHALNRGETVDEILADFPVLKSRQKLEGAIAFIKAHPKEIEAYLAEAAREWDEARKLNPPDLVERARKYRLLVSRDAETMPRQLATPSMN